MAAQFRSERVTTARVLGIDPGTLRAGYAVVDVDGHGGVRYVCCGVLAAGDADYVARIQVICEDLTALLVEMSPTAVALEKAYAGRNVASAMKLAEARGAFRHLCMARGIPVVEYGANHVKRAVTGRARATKTEVVDRISQLFSLRIGPAEDAADALALATCHGMHLRGAATPRSLVGGAP